MALVTGANKGIGFEIARRLGGHGFAVVLAARDERKVTEAAGKSRAEGFDAHGVRLGVTDPATAASVAEWLAGKFGRLDVLVDNAGISSEFGNDMKPSAVSLDPLRTTYETNVFGELAVVQALLPLLRESPPARIVNQSSTLGSLGTLSDPASPFYGVNLLAYDSSKTALNGLTLAFAKEPAAERIAANSACPGWVRTDMGGEGAPAPSGSVPPSPSGWRRWPTRLPACSWTTRAKSAGRDGMAQWVSARKAGKR